MVATCVLAVPYEWIGVADQLFRGPFERAGYFAEFLMLEALNGNSEVAWNESSLGELERLYRIHVAGMELQANEYSARSFGSDLLATIGALLRQVERQPSLSLSLFLFSFINSVVLRALFS